MNELKEQIQALQTFLQMWHEGKNDATFEEMRAAEKQLEHLTEMVAEIKSHLEKWEPA